MKKSGKSLLRANTTYCPSAVRAYRISPPPLRRILKNVSTHCYLLESDQANDTWGRYTFLGYDPKLEITCMGGELKAGNFRIKTEDPSSYLRQLLADYNSPRFDSLPPFTGGR